LLPLRDGTDADGCYGSKNGLAHPRLAHQLPDLAVGARNRAQCEPARRCDF
jgi:hypothetical protein